MSSRQSMTHSIADHIRFVVGDIHEGFVYPDVKIAVLTDHQIFSRFHRRHRHLKYSGGVSISSPSALNVGDYVVHIQHGIGVYKGVEHISIEEIEGDFLTVEYTNGLLRVPVDQFNQVQKYSGKSESGGVKVHKLGGTEWERAKTKTRKSLKIKAEELLRLYAERKLRGGCAYSPDSTEMRQLEISFPWQETPDQIKTIGDVKKDMESSRSMDRLICGDVGFGKTEVAIRAAFKALIDGKQTAVLVPTTILAQQHLNTFSQRLREFAVTIEMLSRFRTPKQQREIVKRANQGKIDILIGTHRILSKDLNMPNLGLLVIDEEHRFGVKHKIKLKELRRTVDVIAMTATPIPRTLQMGLMSIRDMSTIHTPPRNRYPIHTEIVSFHDDIIRRAVEREMARNGQVYFVHNRVQTMSAMYHYLKQVLPDTRICVGHGQMPERELERVMMDFYDHKYDFLLSTMIIESGLDNPNANTILVNRADRFGLAQLYQLRGRVGRSHHHAFAYFMVPPDRTLSMIARRRLRVLEEAEELGSGLKLAMSDLEIRGAGNLLGAEQSGHVVAVGIEMYSKMLKEEVERLRGSSPSKKPEVKIETEIKCYLPDTYIDDQEEKVSLYQRLAECETIDQVEEIGAELVDRFGKLPVEAVNLLDLIAVKKQCEGDHVAHLDIRGNQAFFEFIDPQNPPFKKFEYAFKGSDIRLEPYPTKKGMAIIANLSSIDVESQLVSLRMALENLTDA
ncbi:MAG: transcription-repair coupling factor [Candidatus Cloacimonetes bacterium 4572_55]|nr:MAG: transcription-repair coupling factor [Candidatus Cloacimonetes bacterium 4572_55]